MKIYNSLVKKETIFKLPKEVKMYVCGPTVYNYAHIGNMRTYIFADLVYRYLIHKGYDVKYARNYTDIDDKTIKGSIEKNQSLDEFTNFYIKEFEKDCSLLRLSEPNFKPRPTKIIPEIVSFINELINDGYAYKGEDGSVYFNIAKFSNYGKLNNIKYRELKKGASNRINIDEYDKENASDFVLWKSWKEEDGKVFWNTSLGKGRPGWHIECSVMCYKFLGKTIDIHLGGEDLKFPHHENEIAQSEAHNKTKFVKYWIHPNLLTVNGKKMSKRFGNIYLIREIMEKVSSPLSIKLYYYLSKYSSAMDFNFDELADSDQKLINMNKTIKKLLGYYSKTKQGPEYKKKIKDYVKKIHLALDSDFNTREAITTLFEMFGEINRNLSEGQLSKENAKFTIKEIDILDDIFGIFSIGERTSDRITDLVIKRQGYRENKDYLKADEIREKLKGYVIDDYKNKAFSVYQ